jgi:serine/threonine-protein kinase
VQVHPESRKVGRYEILEVIGVGANSRVARAFDPLIARIVAIKLFPTELAHGQARNRFVQEARVVGQIAHPAVIALHDMGIDEPSQTPYLVMEFIQGQSLEKLLEKGSIPCSKACAWAAEVATALAVAHRKGVIHGDVKPANILITDDDRVKLTDFGMARVASRDSKETPLLARLLVPRTDRR